MYDKLQIPKLNETNAKESSTTQEVMAFPVPTMSEENRQTLEMTEKAVRELTDSLFTPTF